jgi:hypothetical protein
VALSAIGAAALLLFIDAGVKLYRNVSRFVPPDELPSA